jgi:hypothetical protein
MATFERTISQNLKKYENATAHIEIEFEYDIAGSNRPTALTYKVKYTGDGNLPSPQEIKLHNPLPGQPYSAD